MWMLRRARNFDSFVDLRETISASRIVDRRKGEGWFGKVPGITGKRKRVPRSPEGVVIAAVLSFLEVSLPLGGCGR